MGRHYDGDMECERLEERHSILAFNFLQHDCELIIGDLIYEVALELDDDVVTCEHRAESISLVAEEAKSITFLDDWVIESGFDRCLS